MELQSKNAEIVIGIVARLGVDTKQVVTTISEELKLYDYKVIEVKATDEIQGFSEQLKLVNSPTAERYKSYIEGCNTLRRDLNRNDVMARFAIAGIVSARDGASTLERTAYIVNQIKRPEEFELLRSVYGEHYIQISCHAHETQRIARLSRMIVRDHPDKPKSAEWELSARSLISDDEDQEDVKHGQRLRKAFSLSDVVLDVTTSELALLQTERFFRSLFGDNSVTPTRNEYGMDLANTAAQRSSDLSRQVGAAILNDKMEVQALGCNEVGKFGGGTYWEGDPGDSREFQLGADANEERKRAVLMDLMVRLQRAGGLSDTLSSSEDIHKFLFDRVDDTIADAQVMDSLEYGRSVHAEMNAITDAARGGHAIRDCRLFSNTFPCHNCAKHIVASGISEVIYLHPYPKSYARELFNDSILIDPARPSKDRLVFKQFVGITGPMYSRVFTKSRWKREGGVVAKFDKSTAHYIRRTPIPAYEQVEVILLDELHTELRSKGYLGDDEPIPEVRPQ
ncbi:MAG: anti-phage dCTP deaminase [Pseudomonadota bacterium]